MPTAIKISDLAKTYRTGGLRRKSVEAVKNVSIQIEQGEVFGLLGPNGAGKTTVLKVLLGLVRPTSGSSSLLGIDSRNPSSRKKIGFLPEKHRFPSHLTGRQMLSLFGQMSGVSKELCDERIPELLELVGIRKAADRAIGGYSKGMMQRVGIAQAVINDPEIVFLDEPTDGVDPIGRIEIRNILTALHEQGKTVFLNSHLLSEVEQICTRVAILDEGVVAASGSIQELTKTDPVYTITCSLISGRVVDQFGNNLLEHSHDESRQVSVLKLRVESRAQLNHVIDLLRKQDVEVESIERAKSSLEDSFISVISDRNEAAT